MTLPLFSSDNLPDPPTPAQAAQSMPAGKPRLRRPIRDQVETRWASLDDLLEADHQVRVVWAAVCTLDLEVLVKRDQGSRGACRSRCHRPSLAGCVVGLRHIEGNRQRSRTRPALRRVSAVPVAVRRCQHQLSHVVQLPLFWGEKRDELLTQIVGTLLDAGLAKMDRIAQDGMRVRASAGKSSFHRHGTLEECLKAAKEQVETLKQLSPKRTAEPTRRAACRARACRQRATGVDRRSDASVRGGR